MKKEPTKKQVAEWKAKAEKWDALDEAIGKYYPEYDEESGEEKEPEEQGDLTDIGETASRAFGYM